MKTHTMQKYTTGYDTDDDCFYLNGPVGEILRCASPHTTQDKILVEMLANHLNSGRANILTNEITQAKQIEKARYSHVPQEPQVGQAP